MFNNFKGLECVLCSNLKYYYYWYFKVFTYWKTINLFKL